MYHIEDYVSDSSIVAHVFVAGGTCLLSCCLTTGPLPSKDKGYTHRHGESRASNKGTVEGSVFSLVWSKIIQGGQLRTMASNQSVYRNLRVGRPDYWDVAKQWSSLRHYSDFLACLIYVCMM
jgi:hypothetical protein